MTSRQAPGRKALAIIFFIVFLDLMGAGILVPVIPFVVQPFRSDAMTVGLIALAFSAAQFVASPFLGLISDRAGRRPVLLVSLLVSAVGYFLFGWANSLVTLFAARVLAGLGGGSVSTAQAYIADISAPRDRAKNFGLIGAAFGLGFIVGPAMGGALSKISLHAPAFGSGLLSLVTLAAAMLLMPESLPPEKRRESHIRWGDLNPLRRVELRDLMFAVFALNFPLAGLSTNFAVFTHARFGLNAAQNAILFAFLGAMAALTQGLLLRKLAPAAGEARLAIWGSLVALVGFAVLAEARAVWMLYASVALTALGFGTAGPSITGLISQAVRAEQQGSALGTAQSVASLTRVLGPVWFGWFFDHISPSAPYWTGAAWLLLALLLARHATRRQPSPA